MRDTGDTITKQYTAPTFLQKTWSEGIWCHDIEIVLRYDDEILSYFTLTCFCFCFALFCNFAFHVVESVYHSCVNLCRPSIDVSLCARMYVYVDVFVWIVEHACCVWVRSMPQKFAACLFKLCVCCTLYCDSNDRVWHMIVSVLLLTFRRAAQFHFKGAYNSLDHGFTWIEINRQWFATIFISWVSHVVRISFIVNCLSTI